MTKESWAAINSFCFHERPATCSYGLVERLEIAQYRYVGYSRVRLFDSFSRVRLSSIHGHADRCKSMVVWAAGTGILQQWVGPL